MNVQIPVIFSFTLTTNDKLLPVKKPESAKPAQGFSQDTQRTQPKAR